MFIQRMFISLLLSCLVVILSSSVQAKPLSMGEIEAGKVEVTFDDRGPGKLKYVKAVAIISSPPAKVWKVVTDYGNYKSFMPKVTKSYVETRNGNKVEAYTLLTLPWPFQNTWYVNRYVEDRKNLVVRWSMVRGSILDNAGSWKLKPHGKKNTLATYTLKVDPGVSFIPTWMINTATKETLPDIIEAVRERVKSN